MKSGEKSIVKQLMFQMFFILILPELPVGFSTTIHTDRHCIAMHSRNCRNT